MVEFLFLFLIVGAVVAGLDKVRRNRELLAEEAEREEKRAKKGSR
jgi:hypothetical protein